MNVLVKGKYGSVTNNYGVVITKRELNMWKDVIPKANRIIAQEKRLRRMSPAKYGEFAMSFRDTDINRFQNKKAFLSYLKTASEIARGTYFRNRAIAYRKNYIEALKINYGSLADKLIKRIKRLSIAEFRHLVETDKLHSIGYIYYETTGDAEDDLAAQEEIVRSTHSTYSYKHQSLKARATWSNRQAIKKYNEARPLEKGNYWDNRIRIIDTKHNKTQKKPNEKRQAQKMLGLITSANMPTRKK